jgi:ribose transport system substrate-binding protein
LQRIALNLCTIKPMRFERLFIVLAAALVSCCSGCRSSPARAVITGIPRDATEAYVVSEHAGLAQAAARHNISIYWNGPSGSNDTEQQIVLAERAIREGDLGIAITPTAPFALDTVIQHALARGMPVVVLGAPIALPADPKLSFVLNDMQRSGELAAERILQVAGGRAEIAIVGIDPMSPGNESCATAFETALHRIAPNVRIVSHLTGPFTPGQAETATGQAIEKHPHLAAIYALSIVATRGTVAAVRDSQREGKIAIIGTDQALDLFFLVRQKVVDSLVIQDMRGMGAQAVENIVALRDGRTVNPVVYREPVLLDLSNIDTEAMQQRLKMDWRPHP